MNLEIRPWKPYDNSKTTELSNIYDEHYNDVLANEYNHSWPTDSDQSTLPPVENVDELMTADQMDQFEIVFAKIYDTDRDVVVMNVKLDLTQARAFRYWTSEYNNYTDTERGQIDDKALDFSDYVFSEMDWEAYEIGTNWGVMSNKKTFFPDQSVLNPDFKETSEYTFEIYYRFVRDPRVEARGLGDVSLEDLQNDIEAKYNYNVSVSNSSDWVVAILEYDGTDAKKFMESWSQHPDNATMISDLENILSNNGLTNVTANMTQYGSLLLKTRENAPPRNKSTGQSIVDSKWGY